MKKGLAAVGAILVALPVLLILHLGVWTLIPPLSPHQLATRGNFVVIDGIETYYERRGAGPPVILVPPGGSHANIWRYNVEALARRHEVWIVDMPGSGYTAKPESFPYTHAAYARFLAHFMDRFRLGQAVVAGQSLGGTVALTFALDYPQRTAGIVLIDAGGYPIAGKGPPAILRHAFSNAVVMSFASYPATIRTVFGYLYNDPRPFQRDAALIRETSDYLRTPQARAAFFWMQKGLNFDFALPDPTRIRQVRAPTLVLWGRQDRVVPVANAARFASDIPGARIRVIDQAGHSVHEERPQIVNVEIERFLDDIGWSGRP